MLNNQYYDKHIANRVETKYECVTSSNTNLRKLNNYIFILTCSCDRDDHGTCRMIVAYVGNKSHV